MTDQHNEAAHGLQASAAKVRIDAQATLASELRDLAQASLGPRTADVLKRAADALDAKPGSVAVHPDTLNGYDIHGVFHGGQQAQPVGAALEAERVAHVPDAVFKDEFQVWWEDHGQFCRAGGGDYERTFTFQAWRHLYPMLMQARAQLAAQGEPKALRYTSDGALAECPCCGSLDVGGAHDTVNCYGCGLQITKPRPLQNAADAWNKRHQLAAPAGVSDGLAASLFNALEAYRKLADLFEGEDRQTHAKQCELIRQHAASLLASTPPAPEHAENRTTGDKYRAELYDEVWQKARDMGYGNVTEALIALERLKPASDVVQVPRELLSAVFRHADNPEKELSPGIGAPGHSHRIPGHWDRDGSKCEACAAYDALRALLNGGRNE